MSFPRPVRCSIFSFVGFLQTHCERMQTALELGFQRVIDQTLAVDAT